MSEGPHAGFQQAGRGKSALVLKALLLVNMSVWVSSFYAARSLDVTLVQAPGHPGGDGVRLQHRELQAHQRRGGWADGSGPGEVSETVG